MKGPVNLASPAVGMAVFVIVFFLAVVLLVAVKVPPQGLYYKRPAHYSDGFDKGSFKKDFLILACIALPFVLLYFLCQLYDKGN